MATQTVLKTASEQPSDFEQKLQKLWELYADAGDISRAALENVIREIKSGTPAAASGEKMESAGRIGAKLGKVSELTMIAPLKKGGAKRMRFFRDAARQHRQSSRGQGWHRSRHALGLPG
jgi:hypothetical protein